MFEHTGEIADNIADTARAVTAKAKQITGILTGDTDLEDRGRTEARDSAIEDFRDDLRVEQAHHAARPNPKPL